MITYNEIKGHFGKNQIWLYNFIADMLPDKFKLAEIGVFKGRSTVYMGHLLCDMNKTGHYFAIDTFLGSKEHQPIKDFEQEFMSNLALANLLSVVTPIRSKSIDASCRFENYTFDAVIIDGSHEYEDVKADIIMWLPKIKRGGIICGDDYSAGWPGVIKATNELLPNKIIHDRVWYQCL